jgi:vancomycin resistance protein YoaR
MRATSYPRSTSLQPILKQFLVAILLGLLLFFLAFFLLLTGFQVWHAGSIYPGVRVAGIDVGGLTPDTATARITTVFNYPHNGRILLRDGGKTWLVTPAELGVFFDPKESTQRAFAVGRSGSLIHRLREQADTLFNGVDVSPAFIFDQRLAYNTLASIAQQVDTPVIEANLTMQGTEVIVRSGQKGRMVDIAATLVQVDALLRSLQDGVIPLVIKETPPVILDATKQAELARAILSQPLTLTLPEGQTSETSAKGPWVIQPQTLAGLLVVERASSGYQVGLNSSLLRTYLSNLTASVDVYPQDARFTFNDTTHQLEVLQKSVTGRTLDVEATLKAIQDKVTSGQHTLPLVFQYVKPQVEDTATGQSLGITELVHAETSYFYGSTAPRIQNITAAASRFHGLLVAPGQTFSMASAMGDITLDNGYAEALIIVGGKTVQGVGGGVCQVSTTLFRAAFFTGFPIVERHAHAYRVGYYEKVSGNRRNPDLAGLDATVFVPLVDFKFTNDTPYWLLMETYVNPKASSITWKFYSTSDKRSVDWNTTGPVNIVPAPDPVYHENPDLPQGEMKQVDWAVEGADVTVNRTVNRDGQVYIQDTFNTHYEPWSDVYEYGPGTELPTPTPEP